jgi:hypothetical protein
MNRTDRKRVREDSVKQGKIQRERERLRGCIESRRRYKGNRREDTYRRRYRVRGKYSRKENRR